MFDSTNKQENIIAVIGLGYVGLPLAVTFSKKYNVIGYDISRERIDELVNGIDRTREVSKSDLHLSSIKLTSDLFELKRANFHIVTVPTPIDEDKQPDLQPLTSATKSVGSILSMGDIIVFESTVYPGVTEDICLPILEESSGLKANKDFFIGYSPERINPGDKEHTFERIKKVVSASDQRTLETICNVYSSVVDAGVYKASSIRVAEAAKVIENTQRDINIAFINELKIIFDKMNIDIYEVLEAAGTKWNFMPFKPGLVGGHCIGVDPYYLTYKAKQIGYYPKMILSGRQINDDMGKYIAQDTVKKMIEENMHVNCAKVGMFGFTFKENCPDIRNTRVIDIIDELKEYKVNVFVHDPLAISSDVAKNYNIKLSALEDMGELDVVILAVPHQEFSSQKYNNIFNKTKLIIDVKNSLKCQACSSSEIDFERCDIVQ